MKKMMLCALATIALFANCTRNGEPEEKKNTAETESADLIIKRMTSLFLSTTLPTMT